MCREPGIICGNHFEYDVQVEWLGVPCVEKADIEVSNDIKKRITLRLRLCDKEASRGSSLECWDFPFFLAKDRSFQVSVAL